jgi:hypothetical protein
MRVPALSSSLLLLGALACVARGATEEPPTVNTAVAVEQEQEEVITTSLAMAKMGKDLQAPAPVEAAVEPAPSRWVGGVGGVREGERGRERERDRGGGGMSVCLSVCMYV